MTPEGDILELAIDLLKVILACEKETNVEKKKVIFHYKTGYSVAEEVGQLSRNMR